MKTLKILDAIEELFGDTSVSAHKTREALEEIQSDVQMKIDAITADLERDK